MNSRKVWGWMLYDWAAQPYNTLLITFIFAPYFTSVVVGDPVEGQKLWGWMSAIVGLTLAITAPLFGAMADTSGPRRPWVLFFSMLYVVGAMALWWAVPGMDSIFWVLVVFAVGYLGMELSQVFVNAMLPDMGVRGDLGRISGNGFAFGYAGGILALIVMLLFFAENDSGKTLLGISPLFGLESEAREGTRFVGPFSALWFLVFMLPFFLWVPDSPRKTRDAGAVTKALKELWGTIRKLPQNVSLGSFLLSSMFYRDALIGVFNFGGIYAVGVLGWSITQIGIFGIIGGISAAVFSYLGGFADKYFGPKTVITWSVVILIAVCIIIIGTSRTDFFGFPLSPDSTLPDAVFMLCGMVMGATGGTLQAASRTMVVHQADGERITEAFGIYALAGRATSFLAPSAIAIVTDITNNQRLGITPVVVLFLIGLCLLYWVKSDQDQ